jgi:hypothetical protein
VLQIAAQLISFFMASLFSWGCGGLLVLNGFLYLVLQDRNFRQVLYFEGIILMEVVLVSKDSVAAWWDS